MSFAIDVQALRERADARLMANAANRLTTPAELLPARVCALATGEVHAATVANPTITLATANATSLTLANGLTPGKSDAISQLAALAISHVCKTVRKGGNPLLTAEQGDACHAPCWSDAEIQALADRRDRLLRWGYAEQDADDLAERLTLRDREADDRRVCAECHHGRSRRCPDGSPLPRDVLHRCPAFALIENEHQSF